MARSIDYGNLMRNAMRGLIQTVLSDVARNGLPGSHHFYITFDTRAPGVQLADRLRARYPEEMTLVIQNWFEDLAVTADGFAITLNFGDIPERLVVPFDAMKTFVDPSVEFGLRFEVSTKDDADSDDDDAPGPEDDPEPPEGHGQVVRLDRFRKH